MDRWVLLLQLHQEIPAVQLNRLHQGNLADRLVLWHQLHLGYLEGLLLLLLRDYLADQWDRWLLLLQDCPVVP
jgi:hypothetical protein